MRRPGRGELLLLLASLGVLGLGLAAGEALARRTAERGTAAEPGDLARLHVYSERYGWELRRGFETRVAGRPVSINARGYRGPLHGPRRPGVERVLVLGDSIAFGLDVGDGESFAALLERPGEREVLNLAVQGYGTDQQALRLEHEGLAFEPDVVLVALCEGNDFTDVALDHFLYDARHPKPYFLVRRGALELHDAHLRLGAAQSVARWLGERSALFRLLTRPGDAGPQGPHWQRIVDEQAPRWAQNVTIVSHLLRRMAERSREAGARLQVAAFPYRRSWEEGSVERAALASNLASTGVPLSSMAAAFRARGLRFEDLSVDNLGHLGAEGHRASAEILDALLRGETGAGVSPTP